MTEVLGDWKRTSKCGEVNQGLVGQEVTLMGWVQKNRNKGGLVFLDLRDRSGIIQVIFEESEVSAEVFEKAGKLRTFKKKEYK